MSACTRIMENIEMAEKKTNEKEQIQTKIITLRQLNEAPAEYLSSCFNELRTKLDTEIISKKSNQHNEEKRKSLDDIWHQIDKKINSFEKQCIKGLASDENKTAKTFDKINSFAQLLLNSDCLNSLEELKSRIEFEETETLKKIFQNKTIEFVKLDSKLIDIKLVIINDTFIRSEFFQKM